MALPPPGSSTGDASAPPSPVGPSPWGRGPHESVRDWGTAVRTAARIVLAAMAAGAAMGLVWAWVTPSVWLVVRDEGVFPEPSAANRWFSADGWFLALGLGFGVVLGLVAWWRGRDHPVAALVGVFLGGLGGAAVAWWVGGLVGPAATDAWLSTAAVGTRFEETLGLRATAVLLAPAIAGVAVFVFVSSAAAPRVAPIDGPAWDFGR
jgi:hypothetical protein